MKITINANITPDTIDVYLQKQKQKAEKIKGFCIINNINELSYKDSELEFEYKHPATLKLADGENKQEFKKPKPKVETRGGDKNAKG